MSLHYPSAMLLYTTPLHCTSPPRFALHFYHDCSFHATPTHLYPVFPCVTLVKLCPVLLLYSKHASRFSLLISVPHKYSAEDPAFFVASSFLSVKTLATGKQLVLQFAFLISSSPRHFLTFHHKTSKYNRFREVSVGQNRFLLHHPEGTMKIVCFGSSLAS